MTPRRIALGIAAVAAAYLLEAVRFRSGFIADPIGPRAFPFGIGSALLAAALVAAWRETPGAPPEGMASRLSWRHAALLAALVLYAFLLPLVTFIPATTALGAAVALHFGGPPWRALAWSFVISAAVFFSFAYLLGIPLPGA